MTCSHSLSNSECNPGICCPNFSPLIHISAGTRHLTSVVILKSHQLVAQDRTSFRTHLCASTHLSRMGVTKLRHMLTDTHKYVCKKFSLPCHHNNFKYFMAFQVLTAVSEDSGCLG